MQTRRMVLVFCCKFNPYFIRIILFKTLIFQIANSQPVTRGANKLYFALIRNDLNIFAPTNHNKPKYDNNYFFISLIVFCSGAPWTGLLICTSQSNATRNTNKWERGVRGNTAPAINTPHPCLLFRRNSIRIIPSESWRCWNNNWRTIERHYSSNSCR